MMTDDTITRNPRELDRQIAQRLDDGIPSFRPREPQPGQYDELKPDTERR